MPYQVGMCHHGHHWTISNDCERCIDPGGRLIRYIANLSTKEREIVEDTHLESIDTPYGKLTAVRSRL